MNFKKIFRNDGNEIRISIPVFGKGWFHIVFLYRSYNDDSPYYSFYLCYVSRLVWKNGTNNRWTLTLYPGLRMQTN